MFRWFIAFTFFIFYSSFSFASDSTCEQQLMQRIYLAQSNGNKAFAKGLFPSYRAYYFNRGVYKNDDNIFFTALVVLTLQDAEAELSSHSKNLLDSISTNALPVYQKFRNRKGAPVYSFWMTHPIKYFPNTRWLSFFKTNALPDDLDCSAVVMQAMKAPHATVSTLHQYIQVYTNRKSKKVLSTFKEYKKLPAYSTWLGHKVPIDFDMCALSNYLVLAHKYRLNYTAADSASLKLVVEAVRNKHYQTHPEIIAPYYNRTPVILYHLARLMSTRTIPELEPYRAQLVADAQAGYRQAANFLDKVILSTALLRWGVALHDGALEKEIADYCKMPDNDFVFFVANMAVMLPNPFTRFMIRSNIGRFDYYCPAYNDALVLENMLLKKRFSKTETAVFLPAIKQ